MCRKFTPDELNTMDHEAKNDVIYQMQDSFPFLMKRKQTLMKTRRSQR